MVVNAASIAGVLGIALIPTLLANICWSAAVPRAGPSSAGLTQTFIPVFGTVMAAVFLGERATAHQLLGIT